MLKFLLKLRNRTAKRGFTLIELLVVVAIIGLLAAFAVPKLFDAIDKAKKAPGQSDVKTISAALERYYFDKGTYPTGANFQTAMATYLKPSTTFKNGYEQGYFYGSDGTGYILVDAMGKTAATTICGVSWTPSLKSALSVDSTLTKANIEACNTAALITAGFGVETH